MNKFFIGILFFIIPKAFAMEIKVSDRFPTLMELGGKITKVSFGNGMKEYVANVEGRFLALKAKTAQTAATTITIYYIENEGNKNAKTSVFFGGLSYAPERQEIYDLTSPCSSVVKNKNAGLDIVEMEDHVTPELKKALTCIEQEQPILRRFSKKEDKITCALTNMVSTGSDILLKFCIINESPFDYEIEDCYFTFNDKRQKKIKAHVRPKKITVPSGEHTYAIFALDRKIAKKGILAIFEEHNGNRHISIQISSRALLNAPRLKHIK